MSSLFETLAHLLHPRMSNNHRPRIIHPEGFLLLFLIIGAATVMIDKVLPRLSTSEGSVLGYSSTINQNKVVEATNSERQKQGISILTANARLNKAAQAKAEDMFANQYWSHYSPSGKSPWEFIKAVDYTYYVAGENLARDFMQTEDMVKAWMNSPTHRENILNPKYQEIGIAVVNGTLNGTETTLVVQIFGTPLSGTTEAQIGSGSETIAIEQVPVPRVSGALDFVSEQFTNSNSSVLALSLQNLNLRPESPALSPLYLLKAVFLAVIMLVVSVLTYDFVIVSNRSTVRFVGKNFAHIALFLTISFLILFFKSGSIQ